MKTEKQVRTWEIFNEEDECGVWGVQTDKITVLKLDDHQEIVADLEARIQKLRKSLEWIDGASDVECWEKARQALKDDEEAG